MAPSPAIRRPPIRVRVRVRVRVSPCYKETYLTNHKDLILIELVSRVCVANHLLQLVLACFLVHVFLCGEPRTDTLREKDVHL